MFYTCSSTDERIWSAQFAYVKPAIKLNEQYPDQVSLSKGYIPSRRWKRGRFKVHKECMSVARYFNLLGLVSRPVPWQSGDKEWERSSSKKKDGLHVCGRTLHVRSGFTYGSIGHSGRDRRIRVYTGCLWKKNALGVSRFWDVREFGI